MTDFVNELPAKAEEPVDRLDGSANVEIGDARLLRNFAERGRVRRLARLEVSFGKSPIPIAVANEQKARLPIVDAVHDAARGRLVANARARHQALRPTGSGSRLGLPSMNCRTIGSLEC